MQSSAECPRRQPTARHSTWRAGALSGKLWRDSTHWPGPRTFKVDDVQALALRHEHVKGLRRVGPVLDLVDAGAESPKETWLRLLLIDAGYPRPQTQIPVLGPDGYPRYRLDMGWEDKLIAVEYDGDDHRELPRIRKDIVRLEYLARLRWKHIRVVAGMTDREVLARVARAWALT